MKKGLILIFFILFNLLLITPTNYVDAQKSNFTVKIIYLSGEQNIDGIPHDGISLYIAKSLSPLYVDVKSVGIPTLPLYHSSLIADSWDAAIISVKYLRRDAPQLYLTYSPDFFFGKNIYRLEDTDLLASADVAVNDLSQLIDKYQYSQSRDQQISVAKEFQDKYVNQWLLDIPLVTHSPLIGYWSAFNGYLQDEGIIKSIFLGAGWSYNPDERSSVGRSINDLHYSFSSYSDVLNPLYYKSTSDLLVSQSLFSSLMLIDKDGNPHPNLAIRYSYEELDNGASKWYFTLRNDTFWSDGAALTSNDIKFTFDLNSFSWVGATNHNLWKHLERVEIINNTRLSIEFNRRTLFDFYTIGNELIIPEHILNTTSNPYNGMYPAQLDNWMAFDKSPITAGPYVIESTKMGEIITLNQNQNYWFPSELDSPSGYFNLEKNFTQPYYFLKQNDQEPSTLIKQTTLNISTLVFHIGGDRYTSKSTERILFESGKLDFLDYEFLYDDDNLIIDSKFKIKSLGIPSTSMLLLLNLKNPHLQKYDIRKALSHAINREEISLLSGFGQQPQRTPIPNYYKKYYDESKAIFFDYSTARDLFRKHGYIAKDTSDGTVKNRFEQISFQTSSIILPMLIATKLRGKIKLKHI